MRTPSLCFYPYFVLVWFMVSGLFNGIFVFFLGTATKIAIDCFLILLLLLVNKSLHTFSYKQILFISFYSFLTLFSLIICFENNHYGFGKLLKNVILTALVFFNYFILYQTFKNRFFTICIRKLFIFQILLESVLFFFWLFYNKKTGLIGHTNIQLLILQDWEGRFQGSFSEPSCLGLWLGSSIFILLILFQRYTKRICAIFFIFILYSACKAKFALLALPIAFIVPLIKSYRFFSKQHIEIIFLLFIFCFISLFWYDFCKAFYYGISIIFPRKGSATYVTRFGFMWSSIKDICFYPLGHGFGLNYEVFQNIFTDIIPIVDSVNLETWELQSYGLNPNNMGSKDTLSLIISSCGFLGITLYFLYFKRTMQARYRHSFYAHALIFFIFIESIITGNIFADSSFFILIFAKMALNTDRTKVKK